MAIVTPSSWQPLPNRFAYLAETLAACVSVAAKRPCRGEWPSVSTVSSSITEEPGGLAPGGHYYRGDLKLTLTNTWPFTVRPNTNLVISHIASTAYAAYLDTVEKVEGHDALLAHRAYNQPAVVWQQLTGSRSRGAKDDPWQPKIQGAAQRLRASWEANRFFTKLPRVAAYTNLELALTVEASSEKHDLMQLFLDCAGGDAWVKDSLYNALYNAIKDKAAKRAWEMGIVTDPVEEEDLRNQVGMALDDIDMTVTTFVGLEDPWGDHDEIEARVAVDQVLSLAKYIDVLTDLAGTELSIGGGTPDKSNPGNGGDEAMPDLVEEMLGERDIADAISTLTSKPADKEDNETLTGISAGTKKEIIKVVSDRAPTVEEDMAATDLGQVLAKFSFDHRPGEVLNQEYGKVDPLAWYVSKHNSPGSLNWHRQIVRDRRPDFSLALAIAADVSDSMGSSHARMSAKEPIRSLCSSLYVLTEAFRQAVRQGSPSKLWTGCFNGDWEQVTVEPGRVSEFQHSGGTQPSGCIKAAVAWLDRQPVAHRYLVVWTDGDWQGWNASSLDSENPYQRLLFLPAGHNRTREGFEAHQVNEVRDMVDILQSTIGASFASLANTLR